MFAVSTKWVTLGMAAVSPDLGEAAPFIKFMHKVLTNPEAYDGRAHSSSVLTEVLKSNN